MLDNHPKLKKFLHYVLIHSYSSRPRLWTRIFITPLVIKRGRGSIIRKSSRLDIIPSKRFEIGKRTIIESYTIINNQMGDITIGDNSVITQQVVIIGPTQIGKNVILACGVKVTGLTHNFEEVDTPIIKQGVGTTQTTIEDDVWVGANACINQGVTIGTHSLVGAGSVVTKDVPPYCVVVGNPAKIVKQYDFEKKEWVKVKK